MSFESEVEPALLELVSRHPELAPLRKALTSDLRLTADFVALTRTSSIPYGRRSLVLRVLLGDRSAGDFVTHSLSGEVLLRFLDWIDLLGLDANTGGRDSIPKGFASLLDIPRTDMPGFIGRLALAWWESETASDVTIPALSHLPKDELAPLRRVFDLRRLSTAAAMDLCATGGSVRAGRWWFDTGVPALDIRNAMVFIAALLDGPRHAGRIQNRIPVPLTDRWKLKRISLPDVTIFADIVSLACAGVLDLQGVTDDWIGLAPVLASNNVVRLVMGDTGDPDAAAAYSSHIHRWILPRAEATARREEYKRDTAGTFGTGFLFNTARLLGRSRFARFAGYYACTNGQQFGRIAIGRWIPVGRVVAASRRLDRSGIAIRDLGNIMTLLEDARAFDNESAWNALPPVARFALGAAEPRSTGGGSRHTNQDTPPLQRVGVLPLLDVVFSDWTPAFMTLRKAMAGGAALSPDDVDTLAPHLDLLRDLGILFVENDQWRLAERAVPLLSSA